MMTRANAIYVRVSGKRQDTRSQLPDLKRWAAAFAETCQLYGTTTTPPARPWTVRAGRRWKLTC